MKAILLSRNSRTTRRDTSGFRVFIADAAASCALGCLTILCLNAQAPDKAPAKTPPATTAHHKAPMLNPALYKAQAPPTFKAKFTTTKGVYLALNVGGA